MGIEVRLPQIAESMTTARLAVWLKREGDTIVAGEPLAEIETDKTNVELEAPGSGVLERIHVAAGTEGVSVGTLLAVIGEQESTAARPPQRSAKGAAKPGAPPAAPPVAAPPAHAAPAAETKQPAEAPAPAASAPPSAPQRVVPATPLAARMAKIEGLDLSALVAAPGGRITKADVDGALRRRTAASRGNGAADPARTAAPSGPTRVVPLPSLSSAAEQTFVDQPLSAMRRVTAARLQQAKQSIPHFYLQVDCQVDALLGLREQLNRGRADAKVTVTDFIVMAAAQALGKVPAANSTWTDHGVRVFNNVDIAVAVNTPAGLITPIVRGVDRKTLAAVSRELKELADRARKSQLKPDDYTGGTFTISNLGMFGVTSITPIINPPQSCILGVGAIEQRPVARDGQVVVGRVMSCTLAADHRAIDGATGAELLAEIRRLIEEPISILFRA